MWRLTERMVRSTLVTACRLATSPTSTSPDLAKATTDGVVRAPSALAMTVGSPPSRTATTEFVVPRSIPTARAMVVRPSDAADPGPGSGLLGVLRELSPDGSTYVRHRNAGVVGPCSRGRQTRCTGDPQLVNSRAPPSSPGRGRP